MVGGRGGGDTERKLDKEEKVGDCGSTEDGDGDSNGDDGGDIPRPGILYVSKANVRNPGAAIVGVFELGG